MTSYAEHVMYLLVMLKENHKICCRMVADISMESLNSLPDENNVTACGDCSGIFKKMRSPESGVISNNNGDETQALGLTELDNDRAPGDKLLSSTHTRMSPTSCLQNLNDWDLQYSFSELTSPLTSRLSQMQLSVTSEGAVAAETDGDEECCSELMSTSSQSQASSSRDAGSQNDEEQTSDDAEAPRIDTSSANTPQGATNTAVTEAAFDCSARENHINPIARSSVRNSAFDCESNNNDSAAHATATTLAQCDAQLSRDGGQTPDLIRSLQRNRSSAATCDVTGLCHHEMRPTVTLSGSRNDGSYEIDIQNIFPQTLNRSNSDLGSRLHAKTAQIYAPVSKKNLEFRTFQDKYPHSLYKPMHGSCNERDVTLHGLKAKMEVEERLRRTEDPTSHPVHSEKQLLCSNLNSSKSLLVSFRDTLTLRPSCVVDVCFRKLRQLDPRV